MTYVELQAQILAFVDRPEIEQLTPSLIAVAEAELSRRLRVRKMVGRATATIDNEFEILPDDFAGVRSIELSATPPYALEYVAPHRLVQLRGLHIASAAPIFYSVLGREFRFTPKPATPYPNSMLTYYRKIPPLGPLVASNWVLEDHPDAYLYGVLKHAGTALGDSRTEQWAVTFEQILTAINEADLTESGRAA